MVIIMMMIITQRRGPIAAEFAGPGPAAITLPSLFGSELFIIMMMMIIILMMMMMMLLLLMIMMMMLMMMFADPKVHESTKIKAPAYSFGGKTKELSSTVSPAPNSYNTSGLTSKVVMMTTLNSAVILI